jgi:hypothetical protein
MVGRRPGPFRRVREKPCPRSAARRLGPPDTTCNKGERWFYRANDHHVSKGERRFAGRCPVT